MNIPQILSLCAAGVILAGCGGSSDTTNSVGSISLSGVAQEGEILTALVVDADGIVASTLRYIWTADGDIIDGATESTLLLTSLEGGQQIAVAAVYSDELGFQEAPSSSPTEVVGIVFNSSELAVSSVSNVADLSGTITVLEGEGSVVPQTDITTTFGTFSILATGEWTYVLNVTDAVIAALEVESDPVEDIIAIESDGGVQTSLIISIAGAETDSSDRVGVIRDLQDDDTGEIRFTLPAAQAAGRLEVEFSREDDDIGDGDAFINIYNEDTNNDGSILDLRIRDSSFGTRFPSVNNDGVVLGEFQTAIITWAYPGGDTSEGSLPEVSINIDGVNLFDGPYTVTNEPTGGATAIAFRFGDNGRLIPEEAAFTIRKFSIYDDVAGTSLVFEEDFEEYATGDDLSTVQRDGETVYNGSTNDALVEAIAGEEGEEGEEEPTDGGPGTAGNKFATIVDTLATDTGELRLSLPNALDAGRLVVTFDREDDDQGSADAFISLFNSGNNNAGAALDMRIRDNTFGVRSPSFDVNESVVGVEPSGTYQTAIITWAYPNGDTSTGSLPLVTVEVDGIPFTAAGFTPETDPSGGVTTISFRLGGNDATTPSTAVFRVDDIKVYSDTAGTALVFEDNFQEYDTGADLTTVERDGVLVYNGSTSEATVTIE